LKKDNEGVSAFRICEISEKQVQASAAFCRNQPFQKENRLLDILMKRDKVVNRLSILTYTRKVGRLNNINIIARSAS